MREGSVELALSQLRALKAHNLVASTESNHTLNQALTSILEGDKRLSTCPILRNKDQYKKAKESVKPSIASSSVNAATVAPIPQGVKRARTNMSAVPSSSSVASMFANATSVRPPADTIVAG